MCFSCLKFRNNLISAVYSQSNNVVLHPLDLVCMYLVLVLSFVASSIFAKRYFVLPKSGNGLQKFFHHTTIPKDLTAFLMGGGNHHLTQGIPGHSLITIICLCFFLMQHLCFLGHINKPSLKDMVTCTRLACHL